MSASGNPDDFFKRKRTDNTETPKGRGGGRGYQGRGGSSAGRGGNPSAKKKKADPWDGEPHTTPDFEAEAKEILEEFLHLSVKAKIDESKVKKLTIREGDRVLIAALIARGRAVAPTCRKEDRILIAKFRGYSRQKILGLVNNSEELTKEMRLIQATMIPTMIEPAKAPIEYIDLYEGEVQNKLIDASNSQNKNAIKEANLAVLRDYLLRHHNCDTNLLKCYNELEEMPPADLGGMVHHAGRLSRWMLEKGKEGGCRFEVLNLPKGAYKLIRKRTIPQDDTSQTSRDNNRFSSLGSTEEEEAEESKEEPPQSNNSDAGALSQAAAQEEQTKLLAKKEEADEKAAQEESQKKKEAAASEEAKKSAGEELLNDMAAFEKGLNQPNEIIKLDSNRTRYTPEAELKQYLESGLRGYLVIYFSIEAEPLLEKIMELTSVGIVDLIKSPGELKRFATAHGHKPINRLNLSSPLKARGQAPLKSNIMRTYALRVSKSNCKIGDPRDEVMPIMTKLMNVVKSMGGKHVLSLVPYNPATKADPLRDISEIEASKRVLKGRYLVHIDRQAWHDKLIWDMKLMSTLDLLYLLSPVNSKGSGECETVQHFLNTSNIKIRVEDIEESSKIPVVVVVYSMFGDDSNAHKEELCRALRENKSVLIDPKAIELQWQTVTLPSDPREEAMLIKIMADELIADDLRRKLLNTNGSLDRMLYPRVYDWMFFQPKETEDQDYSLAEAIRWQKGFVEDHTSLPQ